jgi:3-dehydroquinate synthetase
MIAATHSDKKKRSGTVRYTLLRKIGEVAKSESGEWTLPLSDDVVKKALTESFKV